MPHTIVLDDATYNALLAAMSAPAATPPATPPAATPPAGTPLYVTPPSVAGRELLHTEMKWEMTGSFYSSHPLTDSNAWVIGFTVGADVTGQMAFAEHGGSPAVRNYVLIRNHDGVVILSSAQETPNIQFGPPQRMVTRTPLESGVRYTLTISNAIAGVASPMVGQLYL